MIIRLSDIADIHAGYPFRGTIAHDKNASVQVVQPKDISDLGELHLENLVKTELKGKKLPMWLQHGDILFIAKGIRTYATYVPEEIKDVICSPSLFQIRIQPSLRNSINPIFLAWQLNQKPIQQYFRQTAEGSAQTNIRKPVLANVELEVPVLEKQNIIAKLYEASIKENALLHKLINNRQQQLNAIATDLIKNSEQFKG